MDAQDEWRKFVSPTCPGPRSAHAVVATSAGGGKLFLFGTFPPHPFAKAENLSYSTLRRVLLARWGVLFPVPEQFPSLPRFLVFRHPHSILGSYRYQGSAWR